MIIWFVIIVCTAAWVQSKLFKKYGFKNLQFLQSADKTAMFENQSFVLTETILNKKPLPLPWLRIERGIPASFTLPSEKNTHSSDRSFVGIYTPGQHEKIERKYEFTCHKRGCFDLSNVYIATGDVLGFQTVRIKKSVPLKIHVWPNAAYVSELPKEIQKWQGEVSIRRWIDPDPLLYNGIRDYRSGDSMRSIHWKATAAAGKLLVKTYEYTASPKMLIVFDITPSKESWGQLSQKDEFVMEKHIKTISYLIQWAHRQRFEIGFFSNGGLLNTPNFLIGLPAKNNHEHFNDLLNTLAELTLFQKESLLSTMKRLLEIRPNNTDILILSCNVDFRTKDVISSLEKLNNSVTIVHT